MKMNRYTRGEPNTQWTNPEAGVRAVRPPHALVDPNDVIEFPKWLVEQNFTDTRQLEDGTWVGIYRLAYTWSVCSDITYGSYFAYRWCFKDYNEAKYFVDNIKDFDEIPTRRESLKGHRWSDNPRIRITDELGLQKW